MAASRDRKREETRRRVYEAALDVFRRDGVAECRIDDIARVAGVSRGTFYFHFPTKDDVLIEHMRQSEHHIAAAITELSADAPLSVVLETLGSRMAHTWEPDPKILPDVAAATLRLAASALVTDRESLALRMALAARFRAAVERGELQAILPADILSDFYLANTLGGMLAWCGSPAVPLKTVLQGVAVLFLQGAGALGRKAASR